jgi:uncharacterized protein HemY
MKSTAPLEQLAWIGLMDKALADGGSEGLREWWRNQNRKTRSQVALQVAMASASSRATITIPRSKLSLMV